MSENIRNISKEKQQAFDNLLKADYWANTHYPLMYGPKILALGASFLRDFLKGNLNFSDFESFSHDEKNATKYTGLTNEIHNHYGRSKSAITKERVEDLFFKTQDKTRYAFMSLFEENELNQFFNDKGNLPKIESALSLFEAAVDALKAPGMIRFSIDYKDSLSPILQKDIHTMDNEEKQNLRLYLGDVSVKIRTLIINAIDRKNRTLSAPFDDFSLERFLTIVAREGSEIVI